MWVQSLGQEDPLEEEMATHSSILAWRIPWTEEPGRLQSVGSQTVDHDTASENTHIGLKMGTGVRRNSHVGSPCACCLEYALPINEEIQPNKIDCRIVGGSGIVYKEANERSWLCIWNLLGWFLLQYIPGTYSNYLAHKIITEWMQEWINKKCKTYETIRKQENPV